MHHLQNEIISYMFIRRLDGSLNVPACLSLWFGKNDTTDNDIRARFGAHVSNALDGKYSEWEETPMGCLALTILVDQFPRNIYRHTIGMFAGDKMARELVNAHSNWTHLLSSEQCIFLPCLVLTHQEDVDDQRNCVDLFKQLEPRLHSELHIFRTIFDEHCRIIERCGCFPHRDHYYNRKTSSVGQALLDNPKLRFDLPLVCRNGNMQFGHDARELWRYFHLGLDIVDNVAALIDAPSLVPLPPSLLLADPSLSSSDFDADLDADLRATFRTFDKNGNGVIEPWELRSLLSATTGWTPTEAKMQAFLDQFTFSCFFTGASYGITIEQFAFVAQLSLKPEPRSACALRRFNDFEPLKARTESGTEEASIDLAALSSRMTAIDPLITSAECKEMFDECDRSGRGMIGFQDFCATMVQVAQDRDYIPIGSGTGSVQKTAVLDVIETPEQIEEPARIHKKKDVGTDAETSPRRPTVLGRPAEGTH